LAHLADRVQLSLRSRRTDVDVQTTEIGITLGTRGDPAREIEPFDTRGCGRELNRRTVSE
jgi:hypothetical protein